jgi:PAS domain S-box-containing protein
MIQVNEMACRVFGYSREEMIGQSIDILVPEHNRNRHREQRQEYYAHPRIRKLGIGMELSARRKSGELFPVEIGLFPLNTQIGMFVLAMVRDLADHKKGDELLRHREAQIVAAAEIQKFVLAQKTPSVPDYEIAGRCYPAEYASGDFFEFLNMPDGSLAILVADVVGHGVGPAIMTASCHGYIQSLSERTNDLTEIMTKMNDHLFGQQPGDLFVTLIAGRLDLRHQTVACLNAGHPPGYVLDQTGEIKATFNSANIALGILNGVEFRTSEPIHLEAKDLLLFFTDGLVEAKSFQTGTSFGIDGVLQVVRENQAKLAKEIIEALYQSVCEHRGTNLLQDDITIVVVKVKGE